MLDGKFLERQNQNVNILGEVRMDSCALFRNFTRMTTSDFELLLQLIGPSIKKQDTNMREAIPISMRLVVTLHFWPLVTRIVVLCKHFVCQCQQYRPSYQKCAKLS